MAEQELVAHEETALATEQDQPRNLLEVIYRAAMDPRVDVEKMSALVALKERIDARDAEVEFNQALARLMPQLPRIEKNGVILNKDKTVRSRYARYEDIDFFIRPLLATEGFAISFATEDIGPRQIRVIGTLLHKLGHSKPSYMTVDVDNPVITGNQARGAAISIGKRYVVIDLLNIICVGQDTDGQARQAITEDQAMDINTKLADTKTNVPRFLQFFEVDRVEEILARDHRKALALLEAKARK